MNRLAAAAAAALVLAGCGGSKNGLYGLAATKDCLDEHDRSFDELGRDDVRLAPLGIAADDAAGILWSPRVGVIVFAAGTDEARQARRDVVAFSRRNASAMTPNDRSELATTLTLEKNVLVLWREKRPPARELVLGCLR